MKTIHKHELLVFPSKYALPKGAQFLSVQTQHNVPQMWFMVDPKAELETRKFVGIGTGHEVPQDGLKEFLGTFQIDGGSLVFHLFEYNY